jgi:O-antigen/teichoic acid export membrane protein
VTVAGSLVQRRRLEEMLRGAIYGPAVLIAAMTFNNAGVFGFHMIVSRALGPSRYGGLGSLLSLTWLIGIATSALTMVVVRQVASRPNVRRWNIRRPMLGVAAAIAALIVVGSAVSSWAAEFLRFKSVVPVIVLTMYGAVVLAQVVVKGLVLGAGRYYVIAACIAAGTVVRLVLGAAFASSMGTSGALAAYAAAELTTAVLLQIAVSRHARSERPIPLPVPFNTLWLTVTAYGGIWFLSAESTLLARHDLSSFDSGLYVAATTAGSIALWLPYNVTSSLFPRLVTEASSRRGSRHFWTGLAATSAMACAATGLMCVFPGLIVALLFGSSYGQAAPVLVLLAVANGLQGVTGFVLHHHLAHHHRAALLPWAAVIALFIMVASHPGGLLTIGTDTVIMSAALLTLMLTMSLRITWHRARATPRVPAVEVVDLTLPGNDTPIAQPG